MTWISVKERLPDKFCEVLLYQKAMYVGNVLICDAGPVKGIYIKGKKHFSWGDGDLSEEENTIDMYTISHWMDLDDIPKPDID